MMRRARLSSLRASSESPHSEEPLKALSRSEIFFATAIMRRCLTTLDENGSESRYPAPGHRCGRGRGLLVLLSPCNSVTREPAEVPHIVAISPSQTGEHA